MPEINGKVIVITGAGSGMGEAYAMLLAGHGAKVVLGISGTTASRHWPAASRKAAVTSPTPPRT
jgi:NAD(P)-dependent dehydrogenase (short-subunit alcohol dehydrogenase family)